MSSIIYDHLLTCDRQSEASEQLISKAIDSWEKSHIINNPPILSGPSPSITIPQVAFIMATSDAVAEKFLRPDMHRLFKLALNEAKSSMVSSCRTNAVVEKIKNTAMKSPSFEIGTTQEQMDGDPFNDGDQEVELEDEPQNPNF